MSVNTIFYLETFINILLEYAENNTYEVSCKLTKFVLKLSEEEQIKAIQTFKEYNLLDYNELFYNTKFAPVCKYILHLSEISNEIDIGYDDRAEKWRLEILNE